MPCAVPALWASPLREGQPARTSVAVTRGTFAIRASDDKSEVPFDDLADDRQAIFWTTRSRSGLVARGAVFRFGVGLISTFSRPRQDRTQRTRFARGAPARQGKSSVTARRSLVSCSGRVFVQGGRGSFVPSPFRPRFPVPSSLRRTCLSASLVFRGGVGVFPFRDAFVLWRPRACWAPGFPNPLRRRTFVRSAGWGAWGGVQGACCG